MDKITTIIEHINKLENVWYVQTLKMFGDTLHGSIITAHYNKLKPKNVKLVWGISEKYINEYKEYIDCDIKLPLPHDLSNKERVDLANNIEKLNNVKKVIKPLVGVWGWNTCGSIADNMFYNAKIKNLLVERKPILPVGIEDYSWSDNILRKHNLINKKYAVLEYISYSLSGPPHFATNSTEWYNEALSLIKYPIIFTGGASDPKLNYGIDLRGCTYRQAKVMIMRASLMVGCGSSLTMLSCSNGVSVPLAEINIGEPISMPGCKYGKSTILKKPTPKDLSNYINNILR